MDWPTIASVRTYRRPQVALGVAWLLVLQAAVALSIFAHEAGPLGPDEAISDGVQGLPDWFEAGAVAVRALTATEVVLVLGGVAVLALWFTGRRAEALGLLAVLVLLPFVQAGIKDIVDRPRPDPTLAEQKTGFGSESFPSGHVMSGTVLYGYLLLIAWEARAHRWRIGACVLGAVLALNAVANVYMGVHWSTDVAGGVLWALVLVLPSWAARPLIGGMLSRAGGQSLKSSP